MANVPIEQAPEGTDQALAEYLERQFVNINIAVGNAGRMPKAYTMPDKPQDGTVYYFPKELLPDITTPGYWGRNNGIWVSLDDKI